MKNLEESYKENLGIIIRDLTKRLPYNVLLRLPDGSIRRLVIRKKKPYDLYLMEAINLRAIPILYPMDPALFIKNIPYGKNIRNKPKTAIPLMKYAISLYRPKDFYHEIIEDELIVVSQRKDCNIEYYETEMTDIMSSFAGIDLCLKYHFDIGNLSSIGLVEIATFSENEDMIYGKY